MLSEHSPFKKNHLDLNGQQYHYVNEGQGEPVIMVHGNPSWSFYYRNLVSALKDNYQTIVPDHIGCGLSDKPGDDQYSYTLEQRINDLESLLDHLDVKKDITLIVHDWGGMIGMGFAARHPDRVKRLVILNTGAFHLPQSKPFPWALWICRNTMLGSFLVRGFNAFSSIASYVGVKREAMAADIRAAYVAPYNNWKNRIATLRFVQDIPLRAGDSGYDLVGSIGDKLSEFTNTPTLMCWGMKDFVFDHHFLTEWQKRLPHAEVHKFDDCGHYILEDASEEVVKLVVDFLAKNK